MFDVITIGSATQDVFLMSKEFKLIRSKEFATGMGECVSFGSKIELDEIVVTTGGGATNAAATFASLGYKTATITRIGEDEGANAVLNDLKKLKIDTRFVRVIKGGKTGYSALLTAENGERSVLVHRGVSESFEVADIPFSSLKTKWFYLTSLAGNLSLVGKIAKFAQDKDISVAFNPGSKELKQGLRAFEPLLRSIQVLILNKEELQMLVADKTDDIVKLTQKVAKPHLTLFITDGSRGSYAYKDGELLFARTRSVPIISRTGAGDAFGSGAIASIMAGKSLTEALQIGTVNAESVIQSFGAKYGIITTFPNSEIRKDISVKLLSYAK